MCQSSQKKNPIPLTYCGSLKDKRCVHIFLAIFNKSHSLYSRRSNSICKSPGPNSPKEMPLITRDIGRSESLRSSSSCSHRIFRPCDLIHGEILGKGFFGQAIKVGSSPSMSDSTVQDFCGLVDNHVLLFSH